MKALLLLFLLLLAAPSTILHAQPVVEPITQNPNAVLLRRIWTITGSDGNRVGDGCGPVGDINGDSISDFAVHFGELQQWRVYLGGSPTPTSEPVWIGDSLFGEIPYPIYGDFLGNGSTIVAFSDFIPIAQTGTRAPQLRFFRSGNGTLSDSAFLIQDMYSRSKIRLSMDVVLSADMDHEAGDELVIANGGVRRQEPFVRTPEIWLYQGGSGFQVDTPSYIVYDTEPTQSSSLYTARIIDLDGDTHFDLVTVGQYADGFTLKMWFGTETSPWTWTTPDREIILDDSSGLNYDMAIGDFDGDRSMDFAGTAGRDATRGTYLYLSRSGKSVRSRTFTRFDADRWFPNLDQFTVGIAGSLLATSAYFNDSTKHLQMLRLQSGANDQTIMSLFSGSRNGPNGAVDGYYSSGFDGLSNHSIEGYGGRLPDCTGDGWDDLITSSPRWPGDFSGIAVILAGGPYIPLDQPTVGVRTEPMADHERGLYLWPNPATTELNIAWRGDLSAMPTRMTVHDVSGKLIAEGEVRPELGSARWATDGVASGRYLLTVHDRSGKVLASTSVVVQK